jgi:hypothetical protein
MNDEELGDFRELFRSTEATRGEVVLLGHERQPYLLSGLGPDQVAIEGPAVEILQRLERSLADSALAAGGPSRDYVGDLIVKAVRVARESGIDAGEEWLAVELARGLSQWKFYRNIDGHFPIAPARLGRTTLLPRAPDELVERFGDPRFTDVALDRSVLVAEVEAADRDSARRRALDAFDEALAVLGTATRFRRRSDPMIADGDGRLVSTNGCGDTYIFSLGESLTAEPIVGLEVAASKPFTARYDWERRCLAAARWLRVMVLTDWPSQALAAAMNALECLFVEGRSVHRKGDAIADAIVRQANWRLPGLEEEDAMLAWLRTLYADRNDAVHSGAYYLEDFEVDRLIELVSHAVRWGSWHLASTHAHHVPRRACTTHADVMTPVGGMSR